MSRLKMEMKKIAILLIVCVFLLGCGTPVKEKTITYSVAEIYPAVSGYVVLYDNDGITMGKEFKKTEIHSNEGETEIDAVYLEEQNQYDKPLRMYLYLSTEKWKSYMLVR